MIIPVLPRAAAACALLLMAGCGSTSGSAAAPRSTPRPSPTPPAASSVHFNTPEAAMRYLASAWNRNDLVQLKHVTDPSARLLLDNMRSEAVDLRLTACKYVASDRDFRCQFSHAYPVGYTGDRSGHGQAYFRVGPARKPGWYMTYFESCG